MMNSRSRPDAQPRRIVVVDDHPVVIEGWRSIVETRVNCEVIPVISALEGWKIWRTRRPDLMVIDLQLADNKTAGIKLIDRLRLLDPTLPILVFSMHRSPVLARRALHAGANGVLNKDAPASEIMTALDEVLRGGHYVESRLATQIALMNVPGKRSTSTRLTAREEEILGLITEGLAYREIADRACISYKTVSNVSLVLREKLGANSLADLVVKGIRYFEGI
ncbi:two component transcriptional regulator, LuxR family [Paracoccus alcaliphilus]|uniref:Two component transcriptional regulator, LuxR family n=1 Tax=Paracoccus alcaliphilus TaxID=34002 RepID=A0A1H8E1G8_9RHOB|nr:response regulator transcription factor [Paracoccus alcaliphilus]SEN12944.1 two component transcriptional regulator, LuxR family [Paracoccus alcaliphilus]